MNDGEVGAGRVPDEDILAEARRILRAAEDGGTTVRLIGGLAIRLRLRRPPDPSLQRDYKDIDVIVPRREAKAAATLLEGIGYEPHRRFNSVNSGRRMLFFDLTNERQLDVFVGSFEMCHVLPIADRLEPGAETVPLAELLLTKLQIIELNEKDRRDILALVREHPVGDDDGDTINAAYIARLCSGDWGLCHTVRLNLERTRHGVGSYPLSEDDHAVISGRLIELASRIDDEPKGVRWRTRDLVGERKRWYEEPEEVQ